MSPRKKLTKSERQILDAIEPFDPALVPVPTDTTALVTGSVDPARVSTYVDRPPPFALCAVSGCGNEIGIYKNGADHRPVICEPCHAYAMKKVHAQRKAMGRKSLSIVSMRDLLAALGVEFIARSQPTTGRSAAYRHGRGTLYPHERPA